MTTKIPNRKRLDKQKKELENVREQLKIINAENRTLIWLDEVMFTQRSVMKQEFSNLNQNIQIDYKDFNIKTTAVVAAMSYDDGMLLWKDYGRSVDQIKFVDFLKRLKIKMKNRRFAILLD